MLHTLALAAFLAPLSQEPASQEGPSLAVEVNRAIARGVGYLRKQQGPRGAWVLHEGQHPGGATALALLALTESGVRRRDAAIVRGLAALEGQVFESVYSASVHLLMCEALPDWSQREAAARRSLDFLVEQQRDGVWAYPWGHLCCSNTQFALMGLRAAHRMGLEVPEETLIEAANGLWHFQDRSGGFLYTEGWRPNSGMTAAALAGLAVLDEVGAESSRVRSLLRKHAKERAAAETWLEELFDATRNRYADGTWTPFWTFAYMWAVERWCGLTGRETVAGRDWYREGAAWLVDTQAADGSWTTDDHPFENTCLALLFLRRATVSRGGDTELVEAQGDAARAGGVPFDPRPPSTARRLVEFWLAGPWRGKSGATPLVEPPFDPAKVVPKARGKLARRPWERVRLRTDTWTNLDELTGRDANLSLWCLATTLAYAPAAGADGPLEALLWLDLEDGWDVYLDGRRLSFERRVQSAINGNVRIPLSLAPGEHGLVILVEDVGGAAAFGARLSAADDGPAPDTLTAR